MLADLVDLDDIGMLQPSHGFALGAEPSQVGRAGMATRQDHFQGDKSLETGLALAL